jgi:hypothetical protein
MLDNHAKLFLVARRVNILRFPHITSICLNPYNSSKWDPIQLDYENPSCTHVVSTNYICVKTWPPSVKVYLLSVKFFSFPIKSCDVWLRKFVLMRDTFLFSEFHTDKGMNLKQMVLIDQQMTPPAILSELDVPFLYYNIYFCNYKTDQFTLFGTANILQVQLLFKIHQKVFPLSNVCHCHFRIKELMLPGQNICI